MSATRDLRVGAHGVQLEVSGTADWGVVIVCPSMDCRCPRKYLKWRRHPRWWWQRDLFTAISDALAIRERRLAAEREVEEMAKIAEEIATEAAELVEDMA